MQNKYLAIIPARAGSKRLPNKNILKLNGKPLISYSIEAALYSQYIDCVVVSSDSDTILEIAKEYGASTIKRPDELASDTSSTFDAIKHAINLMPEFNNIILLQPTSPLRNSKHIDQAIEEFEQKQADAIISVCEMEHTPLWSNTLPQDLSLENFLSDEIKGKRSQDFPPYYRLNGAIYIAKKEKLLENKGFFLPSNIYGYIMDQESSIDIDNKLDFLICETILKSNKNEILQNINIDKIKNIAFEASKAILEIYNKEFTIEYKDDKSPLTQADKKSNEIICNNLKALYPNIPIMSEENKQVSYEERKNWEYYWCIDPIDGTKEFIKKNGEFTINIALINNNEPVLGVVYAPVIDKMYYAKKGEGAFLNGQKLPLKVNNTPKEKLYVVASKSHLSPETQEFINNLDTKEIEQVSMGSSLKLCMVAEGSADIYPRLAPTMEWDTAAADAIVRESGKMTYQYDSDKPMVYNKKDLLNPWFVVK